MPARPLRCRRSLSPSHPRILRRAAARVVATAGLCLALMQVSCLITPAAAQTCGAAGGDNRPQPVRPCDGDTASHPGDGPATGTANSIDLVTGNKYLRERDAAWPGGLVLDRHYNSRNPFPRTLGTGWTHGYDTVLVRIERSGPPERPSDEQPTQFTGGMAASPAPRGARARAGVDSAAAVDGAGADGVRARRDTGGDVDTVATGRRRRGAPAVELQVIQADGRRIVFRAVREPGTPQGVVRYRAVSGDYGAVTEQPGPAAERYRWRWRDGRRVVFDADGRLRRIEPAEGRPLVLDYRPDGRLDAVRAAGGLALRFEYADAADHAGSLRAVRLPDGQRVRYEHDALGLLTRSTDAAGDERRYRYDDPHTPHALTELRDATDAVRGRFAYDPGGRAIASALGGDVQALRVRYTLPDAPGGPGETVVTDARGHESRYRWRYDVHAHRPQWLSASGQGCEACPPVGLDYGYDARGRLISSRPVADGPVVRWRRDAQGRVIEVLTAGRGASASVTTLARLGYAGDDPDAPPAFIERPSVAPGRWHRLDWSRDAQGRVVAARESGWTPVPGALDADLHATRFAPLVREWRIERDTDGLPRGVDGPLPGPDDRVQYERDGAGRLMRVRRPAGLETRFERDRWGRLVATVDQDGIAQRFTRGADGRPLSLEVDGAMLRVGWGTDPRRVAVDTPDTGPLVLHFDAADRLREVEDAGGRRLQVERDAADAVSRFAVRDASGALLMALSPQGVFAGPPAPGRVPQARDPADAPDRGDRAVPIERGRRTWREAGGRAIAVSDDFGRVVATATPQGLRTLQAWDAADRLVAAVRSDGRAVRHRHDAAGRLIESSLPGRADLVRYRWLGGRLTSVSDPWQTVAWQYDRHGRPIAEATLIGPRDQGLERLVTVTRAWRYDAQGRLAGETLPGGHRLDYRYGADGRLDSIDFADAAGRAQPLLARIEWLPFAAPGRGLAAWSFGNGLATRIGHDAQGRIVSVAHDAQRRGGAAALPPAYAVARDEAGRAVRIDRDGRPTAFVRDAAGRLIGVASATLVEGYAWDDDGNRVARVRRGQDGWQVERQRFGRDGRLLAVEHTLPDGAVRAVAARTDVAGTLLDGAAEGGTVTLLPDGRGRPLAIADSKGRASLAAYNAFGQRVVSLEAGTRDGPTLHLHHAGRPQALLDRHGALRQWRVRIGERLVAVLSLDGDRIVPWFVHGDPAGRPVALSDTRGAVHHLPERSPFGEPIDTEPSRPPLQRVALVPAAASLPTLDHRLPGGLLDGELRDYDPATGRWLQPDPLGAAAGPNLHAFVGGDPVDRIDPSGLYQDDVHFYISFFLAKVAGLSSRQALTIANAAQFIDDNPATEPIPSTLSNAYGTAFGTSQQDRLAAYHMTQAGFDPLPRPGESIADYTARRVRNPSNPTLSALLARANSGIDAGMPLRSPCMRALLFGEYLHALQDTFAHRGTANEPVPVGSVGQGHFWFGEHPDWTFNHIASRSSPWMTNEARTLEMEREVFGALKRNFGLVAVDKDGFPIEFREIESVLVKFNRIPESTCSIGECWQLKRALLDETLQSLGLGRLPTYRVDQARAQRDQITQSRK